MTPPKNILQPPKKLFKDYLRLLSFLRSRKSFCVAYRALSSSHLLQLSVTVRSICSLALSVTGSMASPPTRQHGQSSTRASMAHEANILSMSSNSADRAAMADLTSPIVRSNIRLRSIAPNSSRSSWGAGRGRIPKYYLAHVWIHTPR